MAKHLKSFSVKKIIQLLQRDKDNTRRILSLFRPSCSSHNREMVPVMLTNQEQSHRLSQPIMSLKLISKISSDDVAIENTVEEATKPSTYSHYQRRKSKLAKLLTVGKRSSSFEEDEESKHLSVKDHKRKYSFLSLRSLNVSPTMSRNQSPDLHSKVQNRSFSNPPPPPTFSPPKKTMKSLITKPFCFYKLRQEKYEQEKNKQEDKPSYLGQIYKNVKIRISRSFTRSSNSSQETSSVWSRSFTSQSSKDSLHLRRNLIRHGTTE